MPVKKILRYPDPTLKRVSLHVEDIGEEARSCVRDLVDTMRASPGVGLAAVQIGAPLRIIAVDVTPKNPGHGLVVLINPVITEKSGQRTVREGCLSLPEYTAEIKRADEVTVTGLDAEGRAVTLHSKGFEAVAFQHEVDHTDGILFIDRIEGIRSLFKRKTTE